MTQCVIYGTPIRTSRTTTVIPGIVQGTCTLVRELGKQTIRSGCSKFEGSKFENKAMGKLITGHNHAWMPYDRRRNGDK